ALLRTAARIDLDDLTGTTAAGLHLATMGGLWQAFAYGFFGFRPDGARLRLDPRLPPSWRAVEMRLRFRGSRVIARLEPRRLSVRADPAVDVVLGSRASTVDPSSTRFERHRNRWRMTR